MIVDPSIFTIIIDKINLTISDDNNNSYKLTEYAFRDEVSENIPLRKIQSLEVKSYFSPIIVKPRSEEARRIVFISQTEESEYKKLENMLKEGKYKGTLELMSVTSPSIWIRFGFNIDNSCIEGYNNGTCRINYRSIIKL